MAVAIPHNYKQPNQWWLDHQPLSMRNSLLMKQLILKISLQCLLAGCHICNRHHWQQQTTTQARSIILAHVLTNQSHQSLHIIHTTYHRTTYRTHLHLPRLNQHQQQQNQITIQLCTQPQNNHVTTTKRPQDQTYSPKIPHTPSETNVAGVLLPYTFHILTYFLSSTPNNNNNNYTNSNTSCKQTPQTKSSFQQQYQWLPFIHHATTTPFFWTFFSFSIVTTTAHISISRIHTISSTALSTHQSMIWSHVWSFITTEQQD